jgi:hypothetical protein
MNAEEEFLKAFELVAAYDAQRPKLIKEFRLYYNNDGTIIGLWETEHPAGDNYIVLQDHEVYHRTNTQLLRVINKELKVLDPKQPLRVRLKKSTSGFKTVKGHAALVLEDNEQYLEIEYYNRANS